MRWKMRWKMREKMREKCGGKCGRKCGRNAGGMREKCGRKCGEPYSRTLLFDVDGETRDVADFRRKELEMRNILIPSVETAAQKSRRVNL